MQRSGRFRFLRFCLVQTALIVLCTSILGEVWIRYYNKHIDPKIATMQPVFLRENTLEHESAMFAGPIFPQKSQHHQNTFWITEHNTHPEYTINEHGYRGKNFSLEKPPGIVRIAVYGGSAVLCVGHVHKLKGASP